MIGPGKYDGACTVARQLCGAQGAVLIILDGNGGGFSAQLTAEQQPALPMVLRQVADQIEADSLGIKKADLAIRP